MRPLPAVCALAVLLAGAAASSQTPLPSEGASASPPKPVAAPKEPMKDARERTDQWFKDCKLGWDAGTHMSRRDYERTCLRMAQERVKFMRDWEKTGSDRPKRR